MDLSKLNYLAVLAAALSTFLIGALWYSPALFGRTWMATSGVSEESMKQRNMAMVFGVYFVISLIMAFNLAAFLAGPPNLVWGITAGGLAGVGWVAMGMGVTYLFELRSLKLYLIDAGYHAVTFMVMGGILGVWK
jgi:hypothetical protein